MVNDTLFELTQKIQVWLYRKNLKLLLTTFNRYDWSLSPGFPNARFMLDSNSISKHNIYSNYLGITILCFFVVIQLFQLPFFNHHFISRITRSKLFIFFVFVKPTVDGHYRAVSYGAIGSVVGHELTHGFASPGMKNNI